MEANCECLAIFKFDTCNVGIYVTIHFAHDICIVCGSAMFVLKIAFQLHAGESGVRLHDGPDLKLFILVGWDRSFRLLLGPPGLN